MSKLTVVRNDDKLFKANYSGDEISISGPYQTGLSKPHVCLSVSKTDSPPSNYQEMQAIVLDEDDVFAVVTALLNHVGYEPTFGFEEPDAAQAG